MLVAIEVELGVAPAIDHPEAGREERDDPLPVARCPGLLEPVQDPRRRVGDAGGRWWLGRQLVEAGEGLVLAIGGEPLGARDETVGSEGRALKSVVFEWTTGGAVHA